MSDLETMFGYRFQKTELLHQALTHKSAHFEHKKSSKGHNEKLEFLGDAVLDLILSEMLMELFPADGEGNLSKKRAGLVNESTLSQIARRLDLAKHLQLGKGEQLTGGENKPRLLASVYEALIGAVFLDGGFEQTRKSVREHFRSLISGLNSEEDFSQDYKTKLQEEVQAMLKEAPHYSLVNETGPAHDRIFEVEVRIRGRAVTKAEGKSKKTAEQEAARLALGVWKKAKDAL